MKQQIFGLRKAHIDKLLKKMKIDFSSEAAKLEFELGKWAEKNKMLELKIKKLTEENACSREEHELWSFGAERLERILLFLRDQKENEKAEIHRGFAERADRINIQIEDIDKEIKQAEKLFFNLLEQFKSQLENSESKVDLSPKGGSRAVELNPDDGQIGRDFAQQLDHGRLDIEFDRYQETEQISREEEHHQERHVTPIVNEAAAGTELVPLDLEDEGIPADKHSEQKAPNSFWSDVEDWANASFEFPDNQIDKEFAVNLSVNEDISFPPQPHTEEIRKIEPIVITETDSSEHSQVILEQIDSIKTQYIVGKIAGEDLFDLQGNVIVKENARITRDVVELANKCGKLADLIVNMKLTSAGVD